MLEQIYLGEPIGISSNFMHIKASVEGRFGWATYEYDYKVGKSGGGAEYFNKFHKVNVLPFSESTQIHGSYDTNIVRRNVLQHSNPGVIRGLPQQCYAKDLPGQCATFLSLYTCPNRKPILEIMRKR